MVNVNYFCNPDKLFLQPRVEGLVTYSWAMTHYLQTPALHA